MTEKNIPNPVINEDDEDVDPISLFSSNEALDNIKIFDSTV